MMAYKAGDRVTFTEKRLHRAQERTLRSTTGTSTPTDKFIINTYGREHTIKRVTRMLGGNTWEESLMIELEGHYGGYNASSLVHIMIIKNMLDEELFKI
jgi:hypothetical protein